MKEFWHPRRIRIALLLAALITVTWGCATKEKVDKPSGVVECKSEITWDIAKEAEVTMFKCYLEKYKKKFDSIHYTIGIKNVTSKPQRYRVNIFIPEGRAVGGLVPQKGKPPVLEPGQEAQFTYPMKNYDKVPAKIDVIVSTTSAD